MCVYANILFMCIPLLDYKLHEGNGCVWFFLSLIGPVPNIITSYHSLFIIFILSISRIPQFLFFLFLLLKTVQDSSLSSCFWPTSWILFLWDSILITFSSCSMSSIWEIVNTLKALVNILFSYDFQISFSSVVLPSLIHSCIPYYLQVILTLPTPQKHVQQSNYIYL